MEHVWGVGINFRARGELNSLFEAVKSVRLKVHYLDCPTQGSLPYWAFNINVKNICHQTGRAMPCLVEWSAVSLGTRQLKQAVNSTPYPEIDTHPSHMFHLNSVASQFKSWWHTECVFLIVKHGFFTFIFDPNGRFQSFYKVRIQT